MEGFMKKAMILPLIAVLLTLGLLVGCGPVRTQEFNFTGFTGVEVGWAFRVEIVQSDSYSVSITADENLFNFIQVSQEGETLKIGLTQPMPFRTLKAEITMPDLYELSLSGATRGTVQGFSSSHDFILGLSGASRLTGDITAGDAQFTVSGASTIQLQGSADDMTVNASGASRVELASFPVNNTQVILSGASRGTVNLDGRLDADLSGASTLNYSGNPTLGSIKTSGASTLSKK